MTSRKLSFIHPQVQATKASELFFQNNHKCLKDVQMKCGGLVKLKHLEPKITCKNLKNCISSLREILI